MIDKLTALVLCGALFVVACGDDEEVPIAPGAVMLTGTLIGSLQTAFFAVLVAYTASVPGISRTVEIMANDWALRNFLPDGQLLLNGALMSSKEQYPNIPVTGDITYGGAMEGALSLDMLVSVDATDLSTTGTVIIDGVEFYIAELVAAAIGKGS